MEIQPTTGSDIAISTMQPSTPVRPDPPAQEPDNSVNREARSADHDSKGSNVDSYA